MKIKHKKGYKHVIIAIMIIFGLMAIVSSASASHINSINDFDKGHKLFNIHDKKYNLGKNGYKHNKLKNNSPIFCNSIKIQNKRNKCIFRINDSCGIEKIKKNRIKYTNSSITDSSINELDNETHIIIGYTNVSYTTSGYNNSSNVVLKFELSPASDSHFGGVSQLWVYINLYFKDNNTPIPNHMVYMIVGNKTFNYTTDLNGSIVDLFVPEVYGYTEFQFLFNGSVILDNESIIYLEPVSVYGYYYLSNLGIIGPWNFPWWIPNWPPINPINMTIYVPQIPSDVMNYSKNITLSESKYNYNNNTKHKSIMENNHQISYGKMKETGVPLIQLILTLLVVLGILRFNKK